MPHVIERTNSQILTIQLFPLSPDAIRELRAKSEVTDPTPASISKD